MTRQNLHKKLMSEEGNELFYQKLRELVIEVRKDHPRMSARKIHYMLKINYIGINKFEEFVSDQNLGVQRYRSLIKTTRSGNFIYPNLTYGLEINNINKLWASDITYFITPNRTYFIVVIIDVYSRRIIGYNASDNLMMENNIKALSMAFRIRKQKEFEGLVHHSDKGSQYGAKEYVKMLTRAGIEISMAGNSLENAYAERVIGIIKNEYLNHMDIHSLERLQHKLKEAVVLYDEKRPHIELGYLSPIAYEKRIITLSQDKRPVMKLYDFRNNQNNESSLRDEGFLRHKPEEYFKKNGNAVALQKKPRQHSPGSGYSLEGCSPAEPSSASPDKLKLNDVNQINKLSY